MPIRTWWCRAATVVVLLITGCTHFPSATGSSDALVPQWAGRLSVKVYSDPVQTLSAQFTLQGSVEKGSLELTSALGTTIAHIRWSPQEAVLQVATEIQNFDSVNALTRHLTGTELPVLNLFAWLAGTATEIPGWNVDLQSIGAGRLAAHRFAPAPAADLKIVLDH